MSSSPLHQVEQPLQREYEKPALTMHGTVKDLTLGTGSGKTDGGSGKSGKF